MFLRTCLLCLVCVIAPAWGSDGKDGGAPEPEAQEDVIEALGWNVGANDETWKEACAFAPGGELWRLSGSSEGGAVSTGEEFFALRREGQTVLDSPNRSLREGSKSDQGNWSNPVVVARGKGDRLVVVSSKDPRQHGGQENFDFTSGSSSLLAGGGGTTSRSPTSSGR